MAAKHFGNPNAAATPGEHLVFRSLSKLLPSECIIFFEPRIASSKLTRKPDFVVVHPAWGVTVLEVKDWRAREIDQINARQILTITGKTFTSPVEQARTASEALHELLERNDELLNYGGLHAGKLSFPYRHAGILPYIGGKPLQTIREYWGETSIIGADALENRDSLLQALENIQPRFGYMTERHIQVVCNILDADRFHSIHDQDTGHLRGFYDREQVEIATAEVEKQSEQEEDTPDIAMQMPLWSNAMPDEARNTALQDSYVRLVRGFAGTGKTDVLLLRTRYLHKQHPDIDMLVTTFNKPLFTQRLKPELKDCSQRVTVRRFMQLCSDIYADYRRQQGNKSNYQNDIVEVMSVIWQLIKQDGIDFAPFTPQFVAEEITWMKEIGRTARSDYVESVREGRGSGSNGTRLSRRMKEQLFDIFTAYQAKLAELGVIDWPDLPGYVLQHLENGYTIPQKYDIILIDEAQHFAPSWVAVMKHFLKPQGTLFMCEDPSQSVYRFFSWKQRGLNVQGTRTRWLRTPYRNTRQIFQAAYALIETNEVAQQLLTESGEHVLPDLEHDTIREGALPEVRHFSQWRQERDFIVEEVERLIASGIPGHQIGVLHSDSNILRRYRDAVGRKGVQIFETRQQTGLEYTAVFVPSLDEIFPAQNDELSNDAIARQQLEFYMTMTRARDQLYLSYIYDWPPALDPITPFMRAVAVPLQL